MNALPSNRRVMNVAQERAANVITRDELEAMSARDAQCAETWFSGPPSFPAQAARDRRVLLAALASYIEACDDLGKHLRALIDADTRT